MNTTIRTAAIAFAAMSLATVAACSSSTETSPTTSPTATPTASATKVGGMTECTEIEVSDAINHALQEGGSELISLDKLDCADGWAVAQITSGSGTSDSEIGDVEVLEAEGQFWVVQDRDKVCGTTMDNPTTAPADATIPASLWQAGCTTS
ncbi:MAG: hypothetical protein PHU75_05715 [Candidatus Nanopelagicales bacterium]|nr:hypothetical protein [Candidatus Nanopelagicales bacterium]